MGFMHWSDDMSVNVKEIDDQHRRIIEMLSEFYRQSEDDHRQAIGKLLEGLVEYTIYHFETEEKYFDRFLYEHRDEHKAQHQRFVEKVTDIADRFEAGERVLSLEVTTFVKKWLKEHIMGDDKKYTKCFNEHRLF